MAKRVVLAYSGGLDTSVAVKWIQEEWGAEVVALAVDVGQTGRRRRGTTIRAPRARGRRGRGEGRRRARASSPTTSSCPRSTPTRSTRASTRCLGAVAPGHRQAPRRSRRASSAPTRSPTAAPARATTRCGSRCRCARSRPTSRCSRRSACGASPAKTASTTRRSTTSRSASPRRARTRSTRTSWGRAIECGMHRGPVGRRRPSTSTRSPATSPTRRREPREVVVRFERGVPVALDGVAMPLHELVIELGAVVGAVRLGPPRHGREPPGRHQEPRDLRVPGLAGGAARPRRPRVDHARARPHAGEGAPRAALRRARVRRPLVLAAASEALDAFMAPRAAVRHRRGAPAPRARPVLRGRPPRRPRPLQLRPRHLRRRRHASATRTPPASCACGASSVETWAREQGGPGQRSCT